MFERYRDAHISGRPAGRVRHTFNLPSTAERVPLPLPRPRLCPLSPALGFNLEGRRFSRWDDSLLLLGGAVAAVEIHFHFVFVEST